MDIEQVVLNVPKPAETEIELDGKQGVWIRRRLRHLPEMNHGSFRPHWQAAGHSKCAREEFDSHGLHVEYVTHHGPV